MREPLFLKQGHEISLTAFGTLKIKKLIRSDSDCLLLQG